MKPNFQPRELMTKSIPRIAIDARMIHHTGIGRVVKGLINALVARADPWSYLIIVNPEEDPTAVWNWLTVPKALLPRVEVVSFARPVPVYSIAEQVWLPKTLKNKQATLFHSPHFNIPLFSKIPLVVTLHNVIYLSHPESAPSWLARKYASYMLHKSAKKALHITTVSEASKLQLSKYLALDPEAITVFSPSPEEMAHWIVQVRRGGLEMIQPQVRDLANYLLYVGNLLPHKNTECLLKILIELRKLGYANMKAVFVGPSRHYEAHLREQAAELKLSSEIVILGTIQDRDLAFLYDNAMALVHPSKIEGFGLPIAEAMMAECPIIASDIPAFRELGGEALLYAAPDSPEQFAAHIAKLRLQPKEAQRLTQIGFKRAQSLRWSRAAEKLAAVYQKCLATLKPE